MTRKRVPIELNPAYREINQSRARYRVFWGGAGSGKSVNIALMLAAELSDPRNAGMHCLCIRKDKDANADSTRAEIVSALRKLFGADLEKHWSIPAARLTLTHKETGNSFIFRGVKDENQREKLKSITVPSGYLCRCWIEEATQLLPSDFNQIQTRMRGELPAGWYYQTNVSFNPVSSTHWLKRRFFDNPDPTAITCHTTWRDNRFLNAEYGAEMEQYEQTDPEYAAIYNRGEWGSKGGLIITNFVIESVPQSLDYYDAVSIGQDFGFNHANAILLLGWKDGEVYVIREHYRHGMTTPEIVEEVEHMKLFEDAKRARAWMICDAAEPDRIAEWRKAGYKARPVDKGSNKATGSRIDWMKARRIHIDTAAENTAAEIGEWAWVRDRTTGEYTDKPVPVNDDAMAALRYGCEPFHLASMKKRKR